MIDLNSNSLFSDRVNALIEEVPLLDNSTERAYLGCSILGAECERAVQYEAIRAFYPESRKELKNEFPHRVMRIFSRGHLLEDHAIKVLQDSGFMLATEQNGGQFACSWFDEQLGGHLDGIIFHYTKSPQEVFPLPMLWEHKAVNERNFKAVIKEKTRKFYPKYYAQIMMYMNAFNLSNCLMHYTNANTMEYHFELIPYDEMTFQKYYARAERVISATHRGEMLPRGAENKAHLTCKYCNYSAVCWN